MEDDLSLSTEETSNEAATPSMEDTLRQTLDEINSREDSVDRDEGGRFAPKAEKAAAEPKPAAEPVTDEPVVEAKEDPKPESPVTIPTELQRLGIRKEAAAAIAKDPVVMQEFLRRSEEMHKGLETYREKALIGDNFQRALAPYMQNIQAAGVEPVAAMQALFNADAMLRGGNQQQKVQMLHQLARDYGIDIQQAAQTPQQQQTFDPQVFGLQQKLTQMEQWIQQQNQAREQQETQSLNSEITRFASQPDKVFFEEVRNDMAGLLQAGMAADLNDAYEKACYANPTVRAKVLAQQQAKADAERKAQAVQKAQAAKQASAVNISRKGTLPSAKAVGSMDDTIRETARELGLI